MKTNFTTNENYSDLNEVLHQALDQLPADQKNVILLRDYDRVYLPGNSRNNPIKRIAGKVYIFRGRQFLKKYIGKIEVLV